MKRVVFFHPTDTKSYLRVRNEGKETTCTFKKISNGKLDINSVKELETIVKDFDTMKNIFLNMGLKQKAYQENYREVWEINNEIEIMIDNWPGLKTYIEIEGKNEEVVRKYIEKLGFNWGDGMFGPLSIILEKHYGMYLDEITKLLSNVTFDNPLKL